MRAKSDGVKAPDERIVKDIRWATRKHYSAEDKIRIVVEGLRGAEMSVKARTGGIDWTVGRVRGLGR
jgi:transposase-like protein